MINSYIVEQEARARREQMLSEAEHERHLQVLKRTNRSRSVHLRSTFAKRLIALGQRLKLRTEPTA